MGWHLFLILIKTIFFVKFEKHFMPSSPRGPVLAHSQTDPGARLVSMVNSGEPPSTKAPSTRLSSEMNRLARPQIAGLRIVDRFQPWVGSFSPCAASCLRACVDACFKAASMRACSPEGRGVRFEITGRLTEAEAIFQSLSQWYGAEFRRQWFREVRWHYRAQSNGWTVADTAQTSCSSCA